MHLDVRNYFPRIPLRVLLKNVWFLVSLPLVTLVFVLVYSPRLQTRYENVQTFQEQIPSKTKESTLRKDFQQASTFKTVGSQSALADFKLTVDVLNLTKENTIEHHSKSLPKFVTKVQEINSQRDLIVPGFQKSKNFTIHVWKHGERMKRRFLRSYGNINKDPYTLCSVKNCVLTTDDSKVNDSDAVFFHLHQTLGPGSLPNYHPPQQIWIFFTDESPHHTFLATQKYKMKDFNGLFNWSMTYRSDSDVPVPYGRTVPLTESEKNTNISKNYAASKSKGVAILGSNCGGRNHRWNYVDELQNSLEVDIYGGCGTYKCPGHFMRDCLPIGNYKFYLAFENSNCKEYLTEKLWWNAYHKETVPVVMGSPKSDYQKLCPPKSFIHTDDFAGPSELAKYLNYLMSNDTAYNSYFEWKKEFKVVNEHGYFGSPSLHLCRICEALNEADTSKPKTYNNLGAFWNAKTDCRKASWKPPS